MIFLFAPIKIKKSHINQQKNKNSYIIPLKFILKKIITRSPPKLISSSAPDYQDSKY